MDIYAVCMRFLHRLYTGEPIRGTATISSFGATYKTKIRICTKKIFGTDSYVEILVFIINIK